MKKVISISFIPIFALTISYADNYDFRNTKWGMSKEEVKNIEKADFFDEDDEYNLIAYQGEINNMECLIVYSFLENELIQAGYIIKEFHMDDNQYILDYESLKNLLTELHGEPVIDKESWSNDLFKDDPDNWGNAIRLGHLEYFTGWETDTSRISLKLYGVNLLLSFKIQYQSLKYLDKMKERIELQQIEDLQYNI